MPVTVGRHKRDMARSSAFTAFIVLVGGALFSPGCLDVGTKLMGQKGRLDKVEADVGVIKAEQRGIRVEQTETRDDLRALYRAMVFKAPQERLEKPPTEVSKDGGGP